jgi:hypothetical protein
MKQILIQDDTHRRLMLLKYRLGIKSLDDLLNIYLGMGSEIVDSGTSSNQNNTI